MKKFTAQEVNEMLDEIKGLTRYSFYNGGLARDSKGHYILKMSLDDKIDLIKSRHKSLQEGNK
jgi:hypothetical protein